MRFILVICCFALCVSLSFSVMNRSFAFARAGTDSSNSGMPIEHWGIFLATQDLPTSLEHYETLVFSYEQHPTLRSFLDRGKMVYADLSFLEMAPSEYGYDQAQQAGVIMGPSPWTKGKMLVDIRKPNWMRFILETRLQSILIRGFKGVAIHSLAQAASLEESNPKLYHGTSVAVATLIKAFREEYPQLNILVDYQPQLVTELAPYIQGVVVSDVVTASDGKRRIFHSSQDLKLKLNELVALKTRFPATKIYVQEQWDAGDINSRKIIEQTLRKQGLIPYVQLINNNKMMGKI